MRILLIAPPQWAAYGRPMPPVYPPLGLLHVASSLEIVGHVVRMMDADAEGCDVGSASRWAQRWRPDIIGLTATTPAFPEARRWAARLRSSLRCPVLIGGPHASALPGEVLATECFDAVVSGEGEETMGGYVDSFASGRVDPQIPGLSMGDFPGHATPVTDEAAFTRLPLPSWHLVRRPDRYRPPDALHLPVGTVMFSRGCPAGCRFCQSTRLFGTKVRYLTPDRAVEHAWHVHTTIGAKELHIMDDCFTANRTKALAIIASLASHGPPVTWAFGNGVRADMLDDDVLSALASMRVRSIGIGIETADDGVSDAAGKRRSLEQVHQVVKSAQRLGMTVWGFFMFGLPGETRSTMERSARLAREMGLDVAKFEVFKPYPGTELYEELLERGLIHPVPWSQWGIHTPPVHESEQLTARAVWRARRRAVLAFHLRPRFLLHSVRSSSTATRFRLNLRAAEFLLHTVTRIT